MRLRAKHCFAMLSSAKSSEKSKTHLIQDNHCIVFFSNRWKATAWWAGRILTWKNLVSSCTTTWLKWPAASSRRQCCSTAGEWAPTQAETVAGWVPDQRISLAGGWGGQFSEPWQPSGFPCKTKRACERQSPPLWLGRKEWDLAPPHFFSLINSRWVILRTFVHLPKVRTCAWVIGGDHKPPCCETPRGQRL